MSINQNKTFKRRKRIRIADNVELKKPKPMTIKTILSNSKSQDYEEAKSEWELKAIIDEDSGEFSNVCGLCGNSSLKTDFILHNPHTGKDIAAGSTCIIHFGVIKGNVDIESGTTIVNNFIKLQDSIMEVRVLMSGLMIIKPDIRDVNAFLKAMKVVLDEKIIKKPTLDQLGEISYGDRWEEKKKDDFVRARLHALWYKPRTIDTVKPDLKKLPIYKEGSTFGHKSRQSKVYNPMAARTKS